MERLVNAVVYVCLIACAVLTVLEFTDVINIGYFWATVAPLMCIAIFTFSLAAIICFAQSLFEDNNSNN